MHGLFILIFNVSLNSAAAYLIGIALIVVVFICFPAKLNLALAFEFCVHVSWVGGSKRTY